MKGRGDYKSVLNDVKGALRPVIKDALLGAGGALGGLAGTRMGAPVAGAKAGRALAARVSRLFGMGDYSSNEVVVNSLVKPGVNSYSSFGKGNEGPRVRHREFLFDLQQGPTPGAFVNYGFSVNPGLASAFPYAAPMAALYEEYRIHGLVYEFVSSTSEYFANGAMGTIIMAAEYNPSADDFYSKPQMENSDFAISARPDRNMVYGLECASQTQNSYLVRTGASSAPITATDLARMQIAVQSPLAANQILGEVWVSYDIEFMRPKTSSALNGYSHWNATTGAAAAYPSSLAQSVSYGALSSVSWISDSSSHTSTISLPYLPVGTTFCLSVAMTYSGAIVTASDVTLATTLTTGVSAFGDNGLLNQGNVRAAQSAPNGSNSKALKVAYFTTSSLASPVVTLTWPAAPTGTTSGNVDVFLNIIGFGLKTVPAAA